MEKGIGSRSLGTHGLEDNEMEMAGNGKEPMKNFSIILKACYQRYAVADILKDQQELLFFSPLPQKTISNFLHQKSHKKYFISSIFRIGKGGTPSGDGSSSRFLQLGPGSSDFRVLASAGGGYGAGGLRRNGLFSPGGRGGTGVALGDADVIPGLG